MPVATSLDVTQPPPPGHRDEGRADQRSARICSILTRMRARSVSFTPRRDLMSDSRLMGSGCEFKQSRAWWLTYFMERVPGVLVMGISSHDPERVSRQGLNWYIPPHEVP